MKTTIYKSEDGREKIRGHYNNYVAELPFATEKKYVDTSFGKTHMLVAGPVEGKPLFIFQGGNSINPMTLSWFSSLVDTYRIYAPDTIGHPGFSDETRISASDETFATWTAELMEQVNVKKCAFIGPSYGAGIILRLAAFMPEKVDCSVLVCPAGIRLGSKLSMIKSILLPLIMFQVTSSEKYLQKITDNMSVNCMKHLDKQIIGDIFKYVKLEQDMPKLTEKKELTNYNAPTLVIAGEKDVFFPESKLKPTAMEIISNLVDFKTYNMGHFPSMEHLLQINKDIRQFLATHY
ncbi:alpha/beta fold hydrolase [Virgibacillus sp. W0181]|uniref:alpha/beta fold hydrolase n=1 Tax=Virgibacillus sp. W0181 TaxID=3391581 RepID=UPI003F4743F2